MSQITPYLNFDGQAENALKLYQSILGGELRVQKYGDMTSEGKITGEEMNRCMHAHLQAPGFELMASDILPSQGHRNQEGNNVHLMFTADGRTAADQIFQSLADGGKVTLPLTVQFWGDYFGSLTDKFGIHWMIKSNS